jgi:hypothetical protein
LYLFFGLQHLYPQLGVELPERYYASDCRLHIPGQGINWATIKDTVCSPCLLLHDVCASVDLAFVTRNENLYRDMRICIAI